MQEMFAQGMTAHIEGNEHLAAAPKDMKDYIGTALTFIARRFGNEGVQKVTDAIAQVRSVANPPSWTSILAVIITAILSSLFGTFDLTALIAAILALLPK